MHKARAIAARLALLLALVAWAGGQVASSVHRLQVLHVQCVEHGHTIERSLADGGQAQARTADELKAPPDCGEHSGHCALHALPQVAHPPVVASLPPPPPVDGRDTLPWVSTWARGPPLAYAPKTSPPSLA